MTFISGLLLLTFSLGIYGNLLHLLGLLHSLKPPQTLLFSTPILIIVGIIFQKFLKLPFHQLKKPEKILLSLLIIQILISSPGIFVPETSFDALWYHLPLAQVYAKTGSIQPIPELLYSTIPRLADMFFIPGAMLSSPLLIKFTTFTITLIFLSLSYHFFRLFLSRFYSLLSLITLNSIFVISWQSTAAYVDLPRALFELSSLYLLTRLFILSKTILPPLQHLPTLLKGGSRGVGPITSLALLPLACTFTAFALSTKPQALVSLASSAIFIIATCIQNKQSIRRIILATSSYLLATIIIASPWYLYNWHHSGHPLYPLNLPEKQHDQLAHAGATTITDWLTHQLLTLPLIPWDLSFDYSKLLTPVIILSLPLIWLTRQKLINTLFPLILYTLFFILLWWFSPPPENRYLLGIAPAIILLLIYSLVHLPKKLLPLKQIAFTTTLILILINLSIRTFITSQNFPVILRLQSKQNFINSQTNPFNRTIIKKFYSGFWKTYKYQ